MPGQPHFRVSHAGLPIRTGTRIASARAATFRVFCFWTAHHQPGRRRTMSRIFEALKHAQSVRAGKALPNRPSADVVEIPDRRRSRRWPLDIAVYVYGHGPEKEPFHEEAHTLNVNANGALLLLSVPVQKGTNAIAHQSADAAGAGLPRRFSGHAVQPDRRGRRRVSAHESRFLAIALAA